MTSKLHIETARTPAETAGEIAVPGLPNLHSHAFQRAMAGLTERRGSQTDSFWSWREAMYRFVERLTPDDLEAIAAFAYMEMLEAGFTWVAEFHYLHHQPDGRPYDNIAEMSQRIVAAAEQTGIGLTLLPVFYRQRGFGGKPPTEGQRRFLNTRESYGRLMETRVPMGNIGIAPHSLRAVTLEDLRWVAGTFAGPAHIHISEQTKEVDDCLAAHGERPINLLFATIAVDERWCLVHATHADTAERALMAKARATVGLCPITEANLGDGLFDMPDFLAQGGRFGVGSDSNVRISAADELRTLEYGQRLIHRQRNVLGTATQSTGRRLFDAALDGGLKATSSLPAQLGSVTLDDGGLAGDAAVDSWIFSADNNAVRSVIREGVVLVSEGRHRDRDSIAKRYRRTMAKLL